MNTQTQQETKREALFACQECGKKFYTAASADRAAFGDNGCPKCGGSDIDIYVEQKYAPHSGFGNSTNLFD